MPLPSALYAMHQDVYYISNIDPNFERMKIYKGVITSIQYISNSYSYRIQNDIESNIIKETDIFTDKEVLRTFLLSLITNCFNTRISNINTIIDMLPTI